MSARTIGKDHRNPHVHHARSRRPSLRKVSRSRRHGSAISPATSRTSGSPAGGGMLQIPLNDHHGTSQMPGAQPGDAREAIGTGDAREARSVTHPYTTTQADRSRAVESSHRRRRFPASNRTAGQAGIAIRGLAANSLQSTAARPAARKLPRLDLPASWSASATKRKAPRSWKHAGHATRSRLDSIIQGPVETAKAVARPSAGTKDR